MIMLLKIGYSSLASQRTVTNPAYLKLPYDKRPDSCPITYWPVTVQRSARLADRKVMER